MNIYYNSTMMKFDNHVQVATLIKLELDSICKSMPTGS